MTRSWVIPCYQEAEALAAGLASLLALPGEQLVFVDDGSTDGTAAHLADAARRDPRVTVVTHPRNRGVGAAMRSGFAATTGDVVVAYDADRTYPAADAERLVEAVRVGADVATASPFLAGGVVDAPWARRVLSKGAALAYRVAVGRAAKGVRTFTAGFRAYRGPLVRGLAFRSDGFASTAEILGRLLLGGARLVEVPSTLTTRTEGASKMRVLRAMRGHAGVLARLVLLRCRGGRARPGGGEARPDRVTRP